MILIVKIIEITKLIKAYISNSNYKNSKNSLCNSKIQKNNINFEKRH
ncbi:hypothetical protein [Borreliella burgdorferi]|nr:hypothetical protein [Borreliella burgdorferi]AXK69940.1 hypothetical protein BbuMM1_RS190 [Borreliella burgdorferi]